MALPPNFLGDLLASTQGGTVEPVSQNAFGSALGASSPLPTAGLMTAADAGAAPRIAEARPRRSILDMIGGVADTIASVGGAAPLYRQNLDAQRAREIAEEDRQYEIDQRPLARQFAEQKLARGAQEIEGGTLDLQGARNELLNSAGAGIRQVFGRSGAEGVLKVWPLVAKQLGIPVEKAAQIGEALGADTEGTLAALFPDPTLAKGGSKAKEIQIYEMLAANGDQETADAYLKGLASGGGEKPMTAYQREQVRLAEGRLGLARERYENPPVSASERTATAKEASAQGQRKELASSARSMTAEMRDAFGRLRQAGGINAKGQTFGQRVGAWANAEVPLVERLSNPEGYSARQDINRLLTTGIPTLLPLLGGLTLGGKNMDAAKELETWRNAIASASDYDSAMRAINFIEGRIKTIENEKPTPADAPRRQAPRSQGTRQTKELPQIRSVGEYHKLPPGPYIDPNGKRRIKR